MFHSASFCGIWNNLVVFLNLQYVPATSLSNHKSILVFQDLNTTVNEDIIEHEIQNVDQNQVASKDASGSGETRTTKSTSARQKKRKTSPTEEALSIMREIQGRNRLMTDQYKSFGDQVGLRIRDLPSSNAQKIAKHLISNILFEAEMGRYDKCNPLSATCSQPFYPIPNYIQQQFPVPMAPVCPCSNKHFEQPSYSGRMHTSPPSPTPSAHSLTDSDSIDNILMEF